MTQKNKKMTMTKRNRFVQTDGTRNGRLTYEGVMRKSKVLVLQNE